MVWGILTYMDESSVVHHFQYIYLYLFINLVDTSAINNADYKNYKNISLLI